MQSDSSAIRERPSNLDCWLPLHQQITEPFIVHADQELPAFLELESAIKTDRHNHECDCPEPDEELVALGTFALKKRF